MSTSTSHKVGSGGSSRGGRDEHMTGLGARLALAWAFVGIPLAYGIFETAKKASALFAG